MSGETKTETETSSSASASYKTPFTSFSAKLSTNAAFSQSERFKKRGETSVQENRVYEEAKAICSEYEISLNPYVKHFMEKTFETEMNRLPVPFNENQIYHVKLYEKFFDVYGTHYVKHLTLGGKKIYTTSMTSRTYSELKADDVDVESTMDFEMSAAMSASMQVTAGQAKAAATLAGTALGGPAGAMIGSVVDVVSGGKDDNDVLWGADVSSDSKFNIGMHAKTKKQAEDAYKMSNKKTEITEINIGR